MINTDAIIYRICEFYYLMTGNEVIEIDMLEKTFNTFLDILGKKLKTTFSFDFEKVLKEVLDKYPSFVSLEHEMFSFDLTTNDWFNEVFPNVLNKVEKLISSLVSDKRIMEELEIEIPFEKFTHLFFLNSTIVSLYRTLAMKEIKGIDAKDTASLIKRFTDKLESLLEDLDDEEIFELGRCVLYYDYLYYLDDEANDSWHIILFAQDKGQLESLNYAKIRDFISCCSEDDEDEEKVTNNAGNIRFKDTGDIDTFLTYYVLMLNKYILSNPNNMTKNDLILVKNLLLSLPDLECLQDDYWESLDLDIVPVFDLSDRTESSFQGLKEVVLKCVMWLDYPDQAINYKKEVYKDVILALLFIKCFLDLSINEDSKKEILDAITQSGIYKHNDYKIVSELIDDILFNEGLSLKLEL